MARLRTHLLAGLTAVALAGAPARAGEALSICLDDNIPPLSSKQGGMPRGFDLAVARAVAQRLGLQLSIQWFHGKDDRDVNPTDQANALLADGRCQLLGGFPLYASAFGEPAARSQLPAFEGAKPDDRRRWVRLEKLAGSRAYRFNPHVVVLAAKGPRRQIHSLADLKDVKLGAEEGTLADAILMSYGGGILIPSITHVVPGQALFDGMERGEYDATLVEVHRLDAYRASHPGTTLASSGHYHSIGVNIGFLGLAREAPLIAKVNDVIAEMLTKQEFAVLAGDAGLTYLPPRPPDVLATIPPAQLRSD